MKSFFISAFILFGFATASLAQQKNITTADVALGLVNGSSAAVSVNKFWGIGERGRFKIGTGLRFTGFQKNDAEAITAPATLTSGQKGPQVLFSETILANLDTLYFPKSSVGYLNIPIHLNYSFGEKLDIGFNIDVIGVSFGKKQTAQFQSSASASLNNTQQTASPSPFNLLLVGDNDLGSLNSEIYARYWVTERIGLRAGASFQFVEYTTDQLLTFGNDRFRSKFLQPMLALSFNL